jgi:hypothetical protein
MNGDITRLLKEWRAGNDSAREEVVARTYDELRRVARAQLRRERQDTRCRRPRSSTKPTYGCSAADPAQ